MKPHCSEASTLLNARILREYTLLDAVDDVAEHIADGWAQQS